MNTQRKFTRAEIDAMAREKKIPYYYDLSIHELRVKLGIEKLIVKLPTKIYSKGELNTIARNRGVRGFSILEPQKNYLKLSSTCKINTLSHQIPSVTTEMITKQLRSISSHKAAGPDNIPSWVLKDFADILALPVSMLINESFKKEQLPLIWKCANITPLPKSLTVNDIAGKIMCHPID